MKLISLNGATGLVLAAAIAGFSFSVAGQRAGSNEPIITKPTSVNPARSAVVIDPEVNQIELLDIMTTFYELGERMETDSVQRASSESIAQILQMTPDELQAAAYAGPEITRLHDAVMRLRRVLLIDFSTQPTVGGEESPGFPSANYSGLCGSARTDTEAFFAARLVLQTAQGAWSVASRGCDQIAVVAGFGANTSLACIPFDVILFAAEVVFAEIANCDNDIDSAEIEGSYERLGHLHGDVEVIDGNVLVLDDKVNVLDDKVNVIGGNVEDLLAAVEELRLANCELIRLLHTPQGQRQSDLGTCSDQPDYPYDWPNP
jgi:hypothetical protein